MLDPWYHHDSVKFTLWILGRACFQEDWYKPWWRHQLEGVPEGNTIRKMMMMMRRRRRMVMRMRMRMRIIRRRRMMIIIIMTRMMMTVINLKDYQRVRLLRWWSPSSSWLSWLSMNTKTALLIIYIFPFSPQRQWTMAKKEESLRHWTRWVKNDMK